MNQLYRETSPYLLQHKDNPVHWYTWSEEAWAAAKRENKLVLVSIGYSSCHWCHVMEHEVFEDFECAEIMNRNFICIKVDREERPDVDSIYMDAVHLMGSKGGWPLNVFTLPDGRPVYGGTYFPKPHWINILENLSDLHVNEPSKMLDYANRLHEGMRQMNVIAPVSDDNRLEVEFVDQVVEHWSKFWDLVHGGTGKAPKFPMPANIGFLMQYGAIRGDRQALDFAYLTLGKMAMGGICDQAGGGFSRYSVDDHWKVPHFEKMLYDNAQLATVYAQAYRAQGEEIFRQAFEGILRWANDEMKSEEGLYFSALDADSEGVEGKFYTWTKDEIESLPDHDFALEYYRIGREAFWEHGQNILLRIESDADIAYRLNISEETVRKRVIALNENLMAIRAERVRPGLDYKCILSWNAMLVVAFCEAYQATGLKKYSDEAVILFDNINRLMKNTGGDYFHIYASGKGHISAFHDDYAWMAQAALDLYEITFSSKYLEQSKEIVETCIEMFLNETNGLFYFTNQHDTEHLSKRQETQDNVIPSSNSVMCKVLFRLSAHLQDERYYNHSVRMLRSILPSIDFASGYCNWLSVYCMISMPHHELVVAGPEAIEKMQWLQRHFLPNTTFAASTTNSELPLLKDRFDEHTAIYVCTDKTCRLPEYSVDMALSQLQ